MTGGDLLEYATAVAAVVAVLIALLSFLEAHRQRKLTETMVESLAFIAKGAEPKRPRKARAPKAAPSPSRPKFELESLFEADKAKTDAKADLARRREERKALELKLRQEREQWKRSKDVARAIGWVLDRMGSDEEEEEDDE